MASRNGLPGPTPVSHTGSMAEDPDYIEPAVLKARAARSGGAGAKASRPRVRRVAAPAPVGLRVTGARTPMINVRAGVGTIDTSKARINIS